MNYLQLSSNSQYTAAYDYTPIHLGSPHLMNSFEANNYTFSSVSFFSFAFVFWPDQCVQSDSVYNHKSRDFRQLHDTIPAVSVVLLSYYRYVKRKQSQTILRSAQSVKQFTIEQAAPFLAFKINRNTLFQYVPHQKSLSMLILNKWK